jgi:hypothetical protein
MWESCLSYRPPRMSRRRIADLSSSDDNPISASRHQCVVSNRTGLWVMGIPDSLPHPIRPYQACAEARAGGEMSRPRSLPRSTIWAELLVNLHHSHLLPRSLDPYSKEGGSGDDSHCACSRLYLINRSVFRIGSQSKFCPTSAQQLISGRKRTAHVDSTRRREHP